MSTFPYDIPVGFAFEVKIGTYEGVECSFQEVSGLNATMATESIKEGGNNTSTLKIPTRVSFDNLILKRGIIKNSRLVTGWINKAIFNFEIKPLRVDVSLLDEANEPTISWALLNAYPVAIKVSELKAMENSLVIETLELAYSSYTRVN